MAIKKISELPEALSGDVTSDDVLILNDGSTTKKVTLDNFYAGSSSIDSSFNNLTVAGNLTVSGTTTTVNTEEINLADSQIVLNSDFTGDTPTESSGIIVNRDTAGAKTLLWDETEDKWTVSGETFVAGTFEGNVTGTVSDISNHTTDDLAEGTTNTYYSDGQVDAHLSGGTGVDYASGIISIGQAVGTTDDVSFNTVTSNLQGDVVSTSNGVIIVDSTNNSVLLSNNSTDDLPEGTANKYYTDSLVEAYLSGGTGVTFSLGEISIGQSVNISDDVTFNNISATEVSSNLSGSVFADDNTQMVNAALATINLVNNTTDDLAEGTTNTYYSDDQVDAHLSGGTGVTYSSGEISIGQAVGTTDNVSFNDVTVSGNLTVTGTTTQVNTETINLADNQIVLNSDYTGDTPTENGGIEVNRGTLANKILVWNETEDKWTVETETFVAGTFEGNLSGNVTGNVTGTVSDISNHTTDDLAEGTTNLYYADSLARSAVSAVDSGGDGSFSYNGTTGEFTYIGPSAAEARAHFSASGDLSYDSGTGVFSVTTYKTADFDFDFSNKTTDDLTQGTSNLYYSNSLVDSHITAGTGVSYATGTISIGQDVSTTSNVTFSTVTATSVEGDFVGSVFADDSTVLVDAVNGTIPGYVAIDELKTIVANSTDFADFQTRIANNL